MSKPESTAVIFTIVGLCLIIVVLGGAMSGLALSKDKSYSNGHADGYVNGWDNHREFILDAYFPFRHRLTPYYDGNKLIGIDVEIGGVIHRFVPETTMTVTDISTKGK